MHTTRTTVTFVRPFILSGVEGPQPPGRYVVETDEEQLPTLLHDSRRRIETWIILPSPAGGAGSSALVRIDPSELAAALARDAAERAHEAGPASSFAQRTRRRRFEIGRWLMYDAGELGWIAIVLGGVLALTYLISG